MNEYLVICLTALVGSGLTLFSGFGLGTILTPVFALFFPIDLAIALTAIVHFLNNIFKVLLVGKNMNLNVVIRFGIPSILAAILGALLLKQITGLPPLYEYHINNTLFYVSPIKLTIAVVLIFFSLFEIVPRLSELQFPPKYLALGGLLSGFFGGLSGNQGALRSAFLVRAGLGKEAYIASGVVIACLVDVSRLSVYSGKIYAVKDQLNYYLVIAATLSAFAGAFIGNKLVKKITVKTLQYLVAVMLFVFSVLLGLGII